MVVMGAKVEPAGAEVLEVQAAEAGSGVPHLIINIPLADHMVEREAEAAAAAVEAVEVLEAAEAEGPEEMGDL
jgi:hypothetical protein